MLGIESLLQEVNFEMDRLTSIVNGLRDYIHRKSSADQALVFQKTQERWENEDQVQIEKEKKYAKERTFYSEKKYNFKDAEVNMESVKNLPDVPNHNEDFDMDDAYD